jgi:RNA polymerase sigma-B factor
VTCGLATHALVCQSFLMATLSMQKILPHGKSTGPAPKLAATTWREKSAQAPDRTPSSRAPVRPQTPVPATSTLPDLAALDDSELLGMVRSLPQASVRRARACELLVARHRNLVRACVRRYQNGPELTEDLMQVGYVGLMKAINNFDPAVGTSLAAYAQPCITGEIKRHFRDKRWLVHVERPLQELVLEIREETQKMTQQLGHAPSDSDLADKIGADGDQLRQARLAEVALQPWSLDAPLTDRPEAATLADLMGADDPNIELALDLQAVATHWGELPVREQRILMMRFYGDMTQAQIGAQLGISQMQVSRLLAHALGLLRERILDLPPAGTQRAAA